MPVVDRTAAPAWRTINGRGYGSPPSRGRHPICRPLKLLTFLARMFRRRGGDETILLRTKPFSAFRADIPKRSLTINLGNQTPPSGDQWEPVMQNVVAINAAARQGIVAAQATSDEMLLEGIADGGRTAMHILYCRHNVRVYRFILRMVRDTIDGRGSGQPGVPRRLAHRAASSRAVPRFPPGCCRSPASRH